MHISEEASSRSERWTVSRLQGSVQRSRIRILLSSPLLSSPLLSSFLSPPLLSSLFPPFQGFTLHSKVSPFHPFSTDHLTSDQSVDSQQKASACVPACSCACLCEPANLAYRLRAFICSTWELRLNTPQASRLDVCASESAWHHRTALWLSRSSTHKAIRHHSHRYSSATTIVILFC